MITIVSGLPRSGTSLTMQMLIAGGFPVCWDKQPNSDSNNPRGYFEWETAKKLHENRDSNLRIVEGRCVKIFSYMFFALSPMFDYQFIYVDRNIDQVQASHVAFFERQGKGKVAASADKLFEIRWHAMIYLKSFRHLILKHIDLYNGRAPMLISDFLENYGPRTSEQLSKMNECVDFSLLHFKEKGN